LSYSLFSSEDSRSGGENGFKIEQRLAKENRRTRNESDPQESLGPYVAQRRRTLNLRQNDVAEALGYTTQAISSFEMSKSQISVLVLPDLANLLLLSLDDLLSLNPNPEPFGEKNPKADPAL